MTRITEELVRKRAEHNEGEIFSLEELSLHQQNIEKLEYLDKWCRDLKILYLHNNLIPKIENLSRLKKLEYVNFTLNNITRIENLEGCESLMKLDLTINFIGELTSIETLKENHNLRELYLTGNPCSDYEGYRKYVIATLPQLVRLDGIQITKSERILAMQKYSTTRRSVLEQQRDYILKHHHDNSSVVDENSEVCGSKSEEEMGDKDEDFWKEVTKFTPEARVNIYNHMEKNRRKTEKKEIKKKPRKLITDDGRVLNANEPDLDFQFLDDEDNNCFCLELAVYKYLDTSLLEVDVQPNYVRIIVKGKIFQLALPKEVCTESSNAERSEVTGHLLVTMPKMEDILCAKQRKLSLKKSLSKKEEFRPGNAKSQTLEVAPSIVATLDQIIPDDTSPKNLFIPEECTQEVEKNSEGSDFEDDPEVPPLF